MKNKFKVVIMLVLVCMFFTACSSKKDVDNKEQLSKNDVAIQEGYTSTEEMKEEESGIADTTTSDSGTGGNEQDEISVETNRKIIRNVSIGLETQNFEKVVDSIESEITTLGGYAENISMSDLLSSTNRYCNIIARIPAAKLDSFVNKVSETGNVVSKNISAEDITVNYVDMESHVKVLKVEQERLVELIEKAVDLESIILLENRLTEIRYELESYESRLRTYDNLVEYSTVTISIEEVIRYTPQVDNESTWQKMKAGLKDSLYDIKDGATEFSIWFVSNIPYIVFWAAVITVVIIVIIKKRQKAIIDTLANIDYKDNQVNKDYQDSKENQDNNS